MDPNQNLADPNQFLDPTQRQPTVPEVNQNLNVPSQQAPSFAANTRTGEFGGSGMQGFIAGDLLFPGATLSGPTFDAYGGEKGVLVPIAGGDRRAKLSDHFSPFPATRIFYNYNLFANVGFDVSGNKLDIGRNTFGLERSFFNNLASFEIRVPLQQGAAKQQALMGTGTTQTSTQIGNIALSSKLLLRRGPFQTTAVGLATLLPTAPSAEILFSPGDANPFIKLNNQAVSIIPYFAINFTPSDRSWVTFYTQFDFTANGDRISTFNDPYDPTRATQSEKFYQQNLVSIDVSMGRWIYLNPNAPFVRGIATFVELHHTSTLNDSSKVEGVGFTMGDVLENPAGRVDLLNATAGIRSRLGDQTFLTAAVVAPLRSDTNRTFTTEFNLNLSRYFGPQN